MAVWKMQFKANGVDFVTLNHFPKLAAFCKFAGAPICNNEVERVLKGAIRHRKNSPFYKNLIGAAIGEIHMTIPLTATSGVKRNLKIETPLF